MNSTIDKIVDLFSVEGNQTYGENITQTEHAVQCAELAARSGAGNELIAAALLHDIGHLLAATDVAFGNYQHDRVGADYLSAYFPPAVTEPIRLHAQAKRYLCSVEEGYLADLSTASLDSFHHQGGLMTEEEQRAFMQQEYAEEAIQLRRWDDEGKIEEMSLQPFAQYRVYLEAAIQTAN
ncbi:HD domain-containing protein [Aestuariirhabdus sp. Z084]|uniref:HD domain-containing protein n=1 Tax=Aestuariirhabdus haliotis TaxID=2918751 RepID=UPI00201B3B59|nr:HD domain-containing protein [Aestuariirhabdus haliotis]MCL6416939.1 HD domain-containing protein [Aestuariirhabdus haliotis]MCL6420958.1 HD domain-containing protein [Aestuariirhabdus haliotis]